MQIGIDSFALAYDDASVALRPADHMRNLIDQIEYADEVGLDVFGIGEHHRKEFLDSAPAVILGAAAARTKRIRLASAVAVLSAVDPVRLFEQFATLDLISQGRAEMVVGRGSFVDAFPLFGLDLADYDELFAEKLELLLRLRDEEHPQWSGQFRPALTGQGVYPRPQQERALADPLPTCQSLVDPRHNVDHKRPERALHCELGETRPGYRQDDQRPGVRQPAKVEDIDETPRDHRQSEHCQ